MSTATHGDEVTTTYLLVKGGDADAVASAKMRIEAWDVRKNAREREGTRDGRESARERERESESERERERARKRDPR